MSGPLPWLLVALGGALGAVARVALVSAVTARGSIWGVAIVNVLGALLFALVLVAISRPWGLAVPLKALLLSGFMGAFTTFSTFTYETWVLWYEGAWVTTVSYVFANVLGSLVVFFSSMWLMNYQP